MCARYSPATLEKRSPINSEIGYLENPRSVVKVRRRHKFKSNEWIEFIYTKA